MEASSPQSVSKPPRERSIHDYRLDNQLSEIEVMLDGEEAYRWPTRGREVAFPILSEGLGGFRNSLYVVAGATRMGKSTFLLQLAFDLVRLHEDSRVVYFSLDQPRRDVQLRLLAMAGQCHLDYLVRPEREKELQYEKKKLRGLKTMGRIKDRIYLVDESKGPISLQDLEKMVEDLREEDRTTPLFLVIDPIYKIRDSQFRASGFDQKTGHLAGELKTMAFRHKAGILVSTRLDGSAGRHRPTLLDLEDQSLLCYEADSVLLMHAEAAHDARTPFLEWEWGTDDTMVPIYEVLVAKNKMGAFSDRLFYRFYQSYSKFKECSQLENENFRRMLDNLLEHSGEGTKEFKLPHVEDISSLPVGDD